VIHISTRNPRYAFTGLEFLNWRNPHSGCVRYVGNGFYILKRTRTRWRLVYEGSDPPPCSLRVPRDLTSCLR